MIFTSNVWEALSYAAKGFLVKELDASLHCDYSCLRRGCTNRDNPCRYFEISKDDSASSIQRAVLV